MMSVEALRDDLSKTHNVIDLIDLANLTCQHRSAFDFFRQHHREQFNSQDRIVIYTSHDPPQLLLDHLQRAAARIDISNWFILILCPHDLREKLSQSNERYGYDDVVINSRQLPLVATKVLPEDRVAAWRTMCAFPFMNLVLWPSQAMPCCKFQGSLGNYRDSTVHESFHGLTAQRLRQQMKAGEQPDQCSVCFDNENKSTTSHRQMGLWKHGDRLDAKLIDDPEIESVEVSPSITCNFSCRICDMRKSSSIAVEEWKHTDDESTKRQILAFIRANTPGDQRTLDSLKTLITVKNLHVQGGEPFLWKALPELIDHYIDNDTARHMRLEFNTNGSVFPQHLLEKIITHYRELELLISIDNVAERFELERGGHWPEIQKNLKKFSGLRTSKVKVKLAVTVNIQNVLYLNDLVDLADEIGFDGIVWWYLESPSHLCIDHVTQQVKDLVIEEYHSHPCEELRNIAARIRQSPARNGTVFLAEMAKLDARRQQRFALTHEKIYRAMGGCETLLNQVT